MALNLFSKCAGRELFSCSACCSGRIVFCLLHLLLDSGKSAQVAKCWFFHFALDVLNSLLGFLSFSNCVFTCSFFLFVLHLLPNPCMRYHDTLVVTIELDDHERKCLFSFYVAAIFLA